MISYPIVDDMSVGKLNISNTTLICVDCVNIDRAIKAVERCKTLCDFVDVKLLTSIETDYKHKVAIQPLTSLVHYSIFMLKEIYKFIDTKHFLLVQHDGWVLNPETWNPEWEKYDYMGPLFNQNDIMGAGGFSFRSKTLMESVSNKYPEWDGTLEDADRTQKNLSYYEDGEIAIALRGQLEAEGFNYPSLEEAGKFAQGGNPNNNYYSPYPFGFHGSWRSIDQETGFVGENVKHDGFLAQPI